jgi:hypothetical protein
VQPEPDYQHERRRHNELKIWIAPGRAAFIIQKLPNDMGTIVDIILVAP